MRSMSLIPAPSCTTKTGQVTHSAAEDEGCWVLAPVPWAPPGWRGIVPKGAAQEQLLLNSVVALPQECHGIFWINGEVHVPLGVNIYLLRRLGSSALSSLPSLWHLWDTSSLVCGITSSSKLFLTLYSYSSSMCLTILKLIWVMTNRIRYSNHVLSAADIVEPAGPTWNASQGSFRWVGKQSC